MTDQHLADPVQSAPAGVSPSRALVVIAPKPSGRADERPQADFLTQLIACQRRLPAYRGARNAAPETAANAYGRTAVTPHARLNCLV
jgi:hypothetical protein